MIAYLFCITATYLLARSVAKPWTESHFVNQFSVETGHWADAAFDFVRNLSCKDAFLTTENDCWELKTVEKSKMNFYSAIADPGEKLVAVLPDGPLSRTGSHDAVIALDPYPEANLGHLLVVFYINLGWSELQCELNGGHYIGGVMGGAIEASHDENPICQCVRSSALSLSENACMSLALRKRCHNMLLESKWKLKYLSKQYRNKLCEINFFPLVHKISDTPTQQGQKLECRENVEGFAPCPTLRPLDHTSSLVCDPLQTNTQSCFLQGKGSAPSIPTRCRLFERCDHAVLISGGWDRITDRPLYMENLLSMNDVLKENGFPDGNIKMFYSNGNTGLKDVGENKPEVYPSALKLHFRNHLRKLCQSVHCADSLVLYLTGPAMSDGSMLLWDVDGNGQAGDNEVYTVKELLYDTKDCVAQQLYIIADQSYSGILISALESSQVHSNVVAFSSGSDQEYSWNGEFTRHWQAYSSGVQRSDMCVGKSFEAVREYMNSSVPLYFDGSNGAINKTLFGAPCDVRPPFSDYELKKHYVGCQNLPTSVWLRRRTITVEDYEYE